MQLSPALLAKHETFGRDDEQVESWEQKVMERLGHPHAATYRYLRDYFDNLAYAAAPAGRFISYIDEGNFAFYQRPNMAVCTHSITTWGKVPNKALVEYIQKIAYSHWPADSEPQLNTGEFVIHVNRPDLLARLETVPCSRKRQWQEAGQPVWRLEPVDREDFDRLAAFIADLHAGHLLPGRADALRAADSRSLNSLVDIIGYFDTRYPDAWL